MLQMEVLALKSSSGAHNRWRILTSASTSSALVASDEANSNATNTPPIFANHRPTMGRPNDRPCFREASSCSLPLLPSLKHIVVKITTKPGLNVTAMANEPISNTIRLNVTGPLWMSSHRIPKLKHGHVDSVPDLIAKSMQSAWFQSLRSNRAIKCTLPSNSRAEPAMALKLSPNFRFKRTISDTVLALK